MNMTRVRSTFCAVSESPLFDNLTTAIIVLYSGVIGFRTFRELSSPFELSLEYLDIAVTVWFVAEAIVRMVSVRKWTDYFKDGWNVFDFLVIVFSLIPTGYNQLALASRILRVFRLLRLFKARPELKKIIDTVFAAIPAIIDVALLLSILVYIYAVVGSMLFSEMPSGNWRNLFVSMLTLFEILTYEGWVTVMDEVMDRYPWAWLYFVSFIMLGVFIAFNLFIAVLNDKIQSYRDVDEEKDLALMDTPQLLEALKDRNRRIEELVEALRGTGKASES